MSLQRMSLQASGWCPIGLYKLCALTKREFPLNELSILACGVGFSTNMKSGHFLETLAVLNASKRSFDLQLDAAAACW